MIRSKTHGLGQMNEKDHLNAIEPDLRAIVAQLKGQTYLF
jgi:hypothetical protein